VLALAELDGLVGSGRHRHLPGYGVVDARGATWECFLRGSF
jgi:hypothetical protein